MSRPSTKRCAAVMTYHQMPEIETIMRTYALLTLERVRQREEREILNQMYIEHYIIDYMSNRGMRCGDRAVLYVDDCDSLTRYKR